MLTNVRDHVHPWEGYNYYVTCYLGSITVEEKYGQHSYRYCLGNGFYIVITIICCKIYLVL